MLGIFGPTVWCCILKSSLPCFPLLFIAGPGFAAASHRGAISCHNNSSVLLGSAKIGHQCTTGPPEPSSALPTSIQWCRQAFLVVLIRWSCPVHLIVSASLGAVFKECALRLFISKQMKCLWELDFSIPVIGTAFCCSSFPPCHVVVAFISGTRGILDSKEFFSRGRPR